MPAAVTVKEPPGTKRGAARLLRKDVVCADVSLTVGLRLRSHRLTSSL